MSKRKKFKLGEDSLSSLWLKFSPDSKKPPRANPQNGIAIYYSNDWKKGGMNGIAGLVNLKGLFEKQRSIYQIDLARVYGDVVNEQYDFDTFTWRSMTRKDKPVPKPLLKAWLCLPTHLQRKRHANGLPNNITLQSRELFASFNSIDEAVNIAFDTLVSDVESLNVAYDKCYFYCPYYGAIDNKVYGWLTKSGQLNRKGINFNNRIHAYLEGTNECATTIRSK